MTKNLNPFAPVVTPEGDERSRNTKRDGKSLAALLGVFACGGAAAVVVEVLTVVSLIPPISHVTHFDGEFAGLMLVGMPPMAAGCGALAGVTLGLVYRHPKKRVIASIVGSVPPLILYSQSYDSYLTDPWENSPIPALLVSVYLILAMLAGVTITGLVFKLIERRRNLVAMAGGLVSFVAFMAVLIVWYRQLIS